MRQLGLQRKIVSDTINAVMHAKTVIEAWEHVVKDWTIAINEANTKALNARQERREQQLIASVMNKWSYWF